MSISRKKTFNVKEVADMLGISELLFVVESKTDNLQPLWIQKTRLPYYRGISDKLRKIKRIKSWFYMEKNTYCVSGNDSIIIAIA